jgi:hypothetical protein
LVQGIAGNLHFFFFKIIPVVQEKEVNGRIILKSLFFCLVLTALLCSGVQCVFSATHQEERIVGLVIKGDKGYVIVAEDGEYLVKGQDLSKMVNKMVDVTGVITETEKGDTIEVKSFEEAQE